MSGLPKRIWVLAVLCGVFAVLLGAQRAAAEAPVANWVNYESAQAAKQAEHAKIINDALTYGRRVEKVIESPEGRKVILFTEYVPDWTPPGEIFLRVGVDTIDPGFFGLPGFESETVRTTHYMTGRGIDLGEVTSVIRNGIETILMVYEARPGLIDLKPGDKRPVPVPTTSAAGMKPSTFDPKKDGTSGRASGGSNPSPQGSGWDPASTGVDDTPPEKPFKESDDRTGSTSTTAETPASSESGNASQDASGDSHPGWTFWGVGPERENDDGSVSQNTLYQRPDGVFVQTVTTTQKDGTKTEEQHCRKDSQEVDCNSGMTDEPTCRTDCERLTILAELLAQCAGGTCDDAPIDVEHSSVQQDCGRLAYVSNAPTTSGLNEPACKTGRVAKTGAPEDYGDPNDPNQPEASALIDRRDDGVTDPADPGEQEIILGPGENISLDMRGTLRDPANPPGSEDEAPQPGRPTTGDDE